VLVRRRISPRRYNPVKLALSTGPVDEAWQDALPEICVLRLLVVQLSHQPRFGELPIALKSSRRGLHDFCGLLGGQPTEVSELDNFGLARSQLRNSFNAVSNSTIAGSGSRDTTAVSSISLLPRLRGAYKGSGRARHPPVCAASSGRKWRRIEPDGSSQHSSPRRAGGTPR